MLFRSREEEREHAERRRWGGNSERHVSTCRKHSVLKDAIPSLYYATKVMILTQLNLNKPNLI